MNEQPSASDRASIILTAREEGVSMAEAARRAGITRQAVHAMVRSIGMEWKRSVAKARPKQPPTARACDLCGKTIRDRVRPWAGKYCAACSTKRRRTSATAFQHNRDARIRRGAKERYARWGPEEDVLVMLSGLSITELAERLGRTRPAVVNRKRALEKMYGTGSQAGAADG